MPIGQTGFIMKGGDEMRIQERQNHRRSRPVSAVNM
jgi:hypothetical protein